MKRFLHKLFLTCILVCAGHSAFAYDFKVDSFYYTKLSEKTVKLTCDQYDVESNYGPYYYSSTMKKYSGNVVILSSVSDGTSTYQVVAIDDAVFYECTDLVSVDIPLGVKTIGNFAFYGCSNLISMNIPDGVTEIFDFAFDGCNGMLWINIPNSVTFIGGYAFSDCGGLTSITIPDKITFIGDYTFQNCI